MSRLLSLTWLLRRNAFYHPRIPALYIKGFPAKSLYSAVASVYASVNYNTMSGKSRQLHFKSIQNIPANKRKNQDTSTTRQQTVAEVLESYITLRGTGNKQDPIIALEHVAISTERSAKQSLVLLDDPSVQTHYVTLLNDISKSIEMSSDLKLNIFIILKAVGTICRRQKLFINKSDIDIHPSERSKTNETLLPEDGKILLLDIQNIILKKGLNGFQTKDLVTILSSFVEAKQGSVKLFNKLKTAILQQEIKEYTSEGISHIVHCYAKLKSSIDCDEIFETVMAEILHRGLVTFTSGEIPRILMGFADAEQGKSHLYKAIIRDILSRDIRVFTSPELCQILWSFSKVKVRYSINLSELLNRMEKEFLRRGIKRLDDRGLAVLLWSLLEINYFSKKLFVLMRNVALKRNVRKLNPDDLATFLRCFAKVRTKINSHPFFAMIDKELVHRGFSGFNESELATTIWAFAEMGLGSNALIILFKKELSSRDIKDFSAVNLSQIIWGLAKLREKIDMQDLFEFLGNEIVDNYNVSKLGVRQLSLLAWSFAVTNVTPKDLFKVLRQGISKKGLSDCSNTALCQILYAFAVVKDVVNIRELIKSIERKILVTQVGTFDNRQLALLVWSLGELRDEVQSTQVFEILEREVSDRPLQDYMIADICRILWGFSRVKSELNTAVVFNALRKELLRRGLGEFSVAQVTMATIALTTAKEWHEDVYSLFRDEILSRNSRHFSAIYLCSLARSFSAITFDTMHLFSWIGEEVVSRGISAFETEVLLEMLQLLAEHDVPRKLHFFEKIKKQLMERGENEYSAMDISKLSSLLREAGVDTSDLKRNGTTGSHF